MVGSVGIYGTYRISISRRTYMFCFSTLNANTNPNPNCRPGHPTLAANTVAKPAWAPTLAANTVAKPALAPTLAANTVYSQGRCPGRLYHGVSGQGRCPGRQLGLGFVLAFRVEKQNTGSSRNRNPVGAVYSN